MSNARSPRDVCSTTIGTSGLIARFCFACSVRILQTTARTPGRPRAGECSNGFSAAFSAWTSVATGDTEPRAPRSEAQPEHPAAPVVAPRATAQRSVVQPHAAGSERALEGRERRLERVGHDARGVPPLPGRTEAERASRARAGDG